MHLPFLCLTNYESNMNISNVLGKEIDFIAILKQDKKK